MKTRKLHSSIIIAAPRRDVFQHIFAYDLLKIFEKLWYLPVFLHPIFERDYSVPGCERTIYFEDFNTIKQRLITYVDQESFSVLLTGFTSKKFAGLDSIIYQFTFTDFGNDKTTLRCEYTFFISTVLWDILFRHFAQRVLQERISAFLVSNAKRLARTPVGETV
ncbi:hypothetical protein [Flavobacterium sp. CLA17]|uniref:hypothetical protein n=1 Tax=Flavobacterium sp. CLA17 TaxID=2724135 RepID=UPI0014909477|nr:hypothetical protein [Flavobacterium sp. CLA17]QSB29236.1 hypothetical protein HAV12_011010 [Flavobacterium sp. CLA17]